MSLREVLIATFRDLDDLDARYALIGGLAVSVRVEPRTTRDIDLAVAVADDAVAEALIHALAARGYIVGAVLEQAVAGRLATIRMLPPRQPEDGVVVDLLFASSGIEPEVVIGAERLRILKSSSAPVASIGHLIALKLLSQGEHRPQDAMDLIGLAGVATAGDIEQARAATKLIAERGYARGRDLGSALERLLENRRHG